MVRWRLARDGRTGGRGQDSRAGRYRSRRHLGGRFTIWVRNAREALDEAKRNHALNKLAAKNIRNDAKKFRGIAKEAVQFRELLVKLEVCTAEVLDAFEDLLDRRGSDYAWYTESGRRIVYRAEGFARGLKKVLETPLVDESGASANGYQKVLEHGSRLLAQAEET